MIEDDDLLKTYNTIWYKVNADIIKKKKEKKEKDSEPPYNKTFLKTQIKFHID